MGSIVYRLMGATLVGKLFDDPFFFKRNFDKIGPNIPVKQLWGKVIHKFLFSEPINAPSFVFR